MTAIGSLPTPRRTQLWMLTVSDVCPTFSNSAITRNFVADEDWAVNGHAGDGDRHGAAFGAAGCNRWAGEVHLRQQPAAKNVAVRIGVGRHRNGAHGRFDLRRFCRRDGRVH